MDVVIIGGGIVGLTMANLLAQDPALKLALITEKPPVLTWDDASYDLRCSAINRASQNVFMHLDVWQDIAAVRMGYYDQMRVWGSSDAVPLNFAAADIAVTELGHIIENRVIQAVLWNKLQTKNNVSIIGAMVNKLDQLPACKLVIAADGANSWLRNAANIPVYGWDYQHSSLVATVASQLPHNNTAMQIFTADGPLAFLPLDQPNLCTIVWSCDPQKINTLMQLQPEEFCKHLAAEFAYKLGDLKLHGARACFPLRMLHAKNYIASRLVLIGDAAHVVHPMAGQGLNLGILDAAALAEIIQQGSAQKKDIGQHLILRKYERWRKGHNTAVLALVEGLKRFTAIRNSGLQLVEKFNFLKRNLIRSAMGLTNDLPASAK